MNTREQELDQKGKCQKNLKSPISNRNWYDINTLGVIPKLYKMCLNPECKCQKQLTFPPRQNQLKKMVLKTNTNKNSGDQKTLGKNFQTPLSMEQPPSLVKLSVQKSNAQKLDKERLTFQKAYKELKF